MMRKRAPNRAQRMAMIRLVVCVFTLTVAAGFSGTVRATQTSSAATPATPAVPAGVVAYEFYPKGGRLGDYFHPTIKAGETQQLTVVIANTGTVNFEGRTFPANAYSGTNGGFAVADDGTTPKGVTLWLDYPDKAYTIKPGRGVERTFSITVPADASPGQYITAIVLENKPRPVKGSDVFEQVIRFPMPIFITVPGPVEPAFRVGDITMASAAKYARLEIQIANTGNVRVRPAGTVTVSDADGHKLYSATVAMGSVYARDKTSLQVDLPPLAEGKYEVSVGLKDPDTKVTASGMATVTVTTPATPASLPSVQVGAATANPIPDADHIQFLDIKATISNTGEALANVKVVLHTVKDGKVVEDYALNSSLSVPNGQTEIEARYLPATGWTSGDWSFTLSVEAVTGGNGVAQVLATADLGSLTIP
jgi:hypothetical protein